ncbi:DUF6470 family protein [Bacillus salipaludis]|uniref:DUF6470 family protein n=1 Tax=Bacillus salipaludis TaxID=2547811 RepID=UPI003D1A07AE
MQLPQIQLQQTFAQIGLRTTQPIQEIQQVPAEISIKQVPAEMTIEHHPSSLNINQDQAWNELNRKQPSVFSTDMAEFARDEGYEAISEIAEEGDQLAKIENKEDAVVSIASEKACPPPADFNIAFIPSYGSVQIRYNPSEIQVDWKRGVVELEATQSKTIHKYTPGKIEVYLRQKQQLQIDFVGLNVNNKS